MKFNKFCGICGGKFEVDTEKPMKNNELAFGYRDGYGRTLGYTNVYVICPECLQAVRQIISFLKEGGKK